MPKYPGISPYDNEKGTLGTAKKRWEKIFVKEIESDTVSGINANIEYLATTAENSVSAATSAKNAAVAAQGAAEQAAETAATAAAGIQSVVESDVDNTLSIAGVAADAKVTGDWLRDIARPMTLNTSLPATAFADEYMKVTVDSEGRVLYGVKRDGTFTWQKGVPKHLQDKINELAAPTIDNGEYLYVMLDSEDHVLFGVKRDGSFDWQKGLPKPVKEKLEEVAQTVIQSEEFVQLTQDSEGKLIEGVTADGTKKFMAPVRFTDKIILDTKSIRSIEKALINYSFSPFDYSKYDKYDFHTFFLYGDIGEMSKENKVNLTYQFMGNAGTCTCKWQGASSVGYPKKNFTIGKMTPAIDVGWGNQKKYVLKADYVDCSHARNVVAAKLWGDIVKSRPSVDGRLTNLPNCGAIDGFPVMLVINDEYQGLYNLTIPKDPWMLGMGNSPTEAMITAESNNPSTMFKATVSKEDMLAAKYWEIEYIPDEDNPDWAIDSFNRMITAVINSTGVNYRDTLQDYLDIDGAIDYYIHTCLLGNWDGVSHNFIMSTYDGVKWFFTPYDLDLVLGMVTDDKANARIGTTFDFVQKTSRVFHLIYTYDKASLKARYAVLRESVMSEENLMSTLVKHLRPIPKPVIDRDVEMWPGMQTTLIGYFDQIMEWYRVRIQYMDMEIDSL